MVLVRTYWFPGCLTRPTRSPRLATSRRSRSTSKLFRPLVVRSILASAGCHTWLRGVVRPSAAETAEPRARPTGRHRRGALEAEVPPLGVLDAGLDRRLHPD